MAEQLKIDSIKTQVSHWITILLTIYLTVIAFLLPGMVIIPLRWLTAALLALCGLLWIVRGTGLPPRILWPLLGIGVSLAIATVFGINFSDSSFAVTYWALVVVSFWLLVDMDRETVYNTFYRATGAVIVLDGLQIVIHTLQGTITPRPGLFFTAIPNTLSMLLIIHALLTLQKRQASPPEHLTRYNIWLGVLYGVLVFALSRSGWMAYMAGFGVLIVLDREVRQWVLRPLRAIVLVVVAAATNSFLLRWLWRVYTNVYVSTLQVSEAINTLSSGRMDVWRGAINMLTENPLTGVGPRNFGPIFMEGRSGFWWSNPHNVPLAFAAEQGIVGLAALAALFLVAGWQAVQLYREADTRPVGILALAYFAAMLTHSMFEWPYWIPGAGLMVLVGWQLLLPEQRERQPASRWLALALLIFALALNLMQINTPYINQ